jgi:RNA polymerase sigma-70 factor (sigma-E family)
VAGARQGTANGRVRRDGAGLIPEPRDPGGQGPESFRAFYEREFRGLVALASGLIGDRSMAEDITQDALVVAYRRWDEVAALESPVFWVRRVVANKSVSLIRRRLAEVRALTRIGSLADRRADAPESDADFWALVRSLPRRQAQVVALHYVSDMSVIEIAETLGCAEGSVKASLFKARQHLLKTLRVSPEEVRAESKPVTP